MTGPCYVVDFYATPCIYARGPLFILRLHRILLSALSTVRTRREFARFEKHRYPDATLPIAKLYVNNRIEVISAADLYSAFHAGQTWTTYARIFFPTWHSFAIDSSLSCALSMRTHAVRLVSSYEVYSFTFLLSNKEDGRSRNKRGRFKWRRKGKINTHTHIYSYTWKCRRILSCCPKPI